MSDIVSKLTETSIQVETTEVVMKTIDVGDLKSHRQMLVRQLLLADDSYIKQRQGLVDEINRCDELCKLAMTAGISEEVVGHIEMIPEAPMPMPEKIASDPMESEMPDMGVEPVKSEEPIV